MTVKPGDRVVLAMRDLSRPWGLGYRTSDFTGTVIAVDKPGAPRGVEIQLDRPNGYPTCYATHEEIRLLEEPE